MGILSTTTKAAKTAKQLKANRGVRRTHCAVLGCHRRVDVRANICRKCSAAGAWVDG